jgi:hypothetical protein
MAMLSRGVSIIKGHWQGVSSLLGCELDEAEWPSDRGHKLIG